VRDNTHRDVADGIGRSIGTVFFALGMAGVPPADALAGPVLIRLLDDLGLSHSAARSTILRMRRMGLLLTVRTGRTAAYAPSPAVILGHERHRNQFVGDGPAWDGSFHALLVKVPERHRAFRDELRRMATVVGYRTLRAGLLIAPSDRSAELTTTLGRIPPGASIVAARLEFAPEDTRRVASELWELDELAERYRALATAARTASRAARDQPPSGAEAVQALAAATLPIFEAIADDPGLPADLLPSAWPGPELSAALGEALRSFGPAIGHHLALLGESKRGALDQGGP